MDKSNLKLQEQKISSEPKSFNCYFNGDSNVLIEIFFNKIKPMEGIVKYKMVGWSGFPTLQDEAKKIGLEWSKKIQSQSKYADYKVSVYFHLLSKTIRFELKSRNFLLVQLESSNSVENQILSYDFNKNKSNKTIFDCGKTDYFDNLDLELCKDEGKKLSFKLEKQYVGKTFIVFINSNKKQIQIITK